MTQNDMDSFDGAFRYLNEPDEQGLKLLPAYIDCNVL